MDLSGAVHARSTRFGVLENPHTLSQRTCSNLWYVAGHSLTPLSRARVYSRHTSVYCPRSNAVANSREVGDGRAVQSTRDREGGGAAVLIRAVGIPRMRRNRNAAVRNNMPR
jgi:hypothetical protein